MPGELTEMKRNQIRNAYSRSEHSFNGSDAFQMSQLTSKIADKEKRIEEYKEHIATYNTSYDMLKE